MTKGSKGWLALEATRILNQEDTAWLAYLPQAAEIFMPPVIEGKLKEQIKPEQTGLLKAIKLADDIGRYLAEKRSAGIETISIYEMYRHTVKPVEDM